MPMLGLSRMDIKDADNKFTRIKKKYKQLFEAGVKIDTYQKLECAARHWFNFGFVLGKKLAEVTNGNHNSS
ncbi:MAG: hypothetical protein PHY77_04250 [Desulfotomaculaceae bacterium]|nr:hypothetical protein [Desulfotomaculaceae bacterium]